MSCFNVKQIFKTSHADTQILLKDTNTCARGWTTHFVTDLPHKMQNTMLPGPELTGQLGTKDKGVLRWGTDLDHTTTGVQTHTAVMQITHTHRHNSENHTETNQVVNTACR